MRKRLTERITHAKKGSFGYTLTEMLVVVGIIAIVCAIAIPSIIGIRDALRFAQANNYAKSIFLAVQQNLTEMRSDGGLGPVRQAKDNLLAHGINTRIARHHCAFPDSEWSSEYVFTASGDSYLKTTYDLVLPANSVEGTLRNEQVVIEYNPITGNVFAVFYCEDDFDLLENYKNGTVSRAKADRKRDMIGYYDGSGLSSANLEVEQSQARVEFTNGEEGVVTVRIPMPSQYYTNHNVFAEGLQVKLTIRGESSWGGVMEVVIKESGTTDNCTLHEGNTMLVTYPLDSLRDFMSFANLSVDHAQGVNAAEEGEAEPDAPASLTTLGDHSFVQGRNILPGDNVTIQADVSFVNTDNNPAVEIAPGILAGVNPMFDYLLPSPTEPDKYILAVSNGRNLQNLNAVHPWIADSVKSVVFTDDINWNSTAAHYNTNYGSGSIYTNSAAEAPARALPYFVPIHNEHLFGTATFTYKDGGTASGGFQGVLERILQWLLGSDFARNEKVPTLTDEMDTTVVNGKQIGDTHATIDGQGYKVLYLNVDSTVYEPCTTTFYALGDHQIVDYYFTGLFGYANTTINDLHVVNPRIKGHNFVSGIYMDPATGALLGAGGYNTLITGCSAYLDSSADDFNWSYYGTGMQTDYTAAGSMNWYGVSGEGAVGGLVGYAKSHRTVIGELGSDTRYLAFSNCFAAVPVSGNVRGTTVKDYGYSNGIGGFIGNSQLTNFYNCYSSGTVHAKNTCFQTAGWSDDAVNLLGLGGNGRLSQGAGGFVGTSHGTRYTNCFTTSNVINNNGNAATGGFVGMMCYDATKKYGHHSDSLGSTSVDQHTVFDSCYAAGMCTNASGKFLESFSGANGKIVVNYGNLNTFYTGDYYKLLAPYVITTRYNMPPYDSLYIFKDSYYLSQYKGTNNVTQEYSSRCAKPITYDELTGLSLKYDDESENGWLWTQVRNIHNERLDADDILPVIRETLSAVFNLKLSDIINGFFGNKTEAMLRVEEILGALSENPPTYEVYFVFDKYYNKTLNSIYFNAYNEGFPSLPWENASESTTHYYGSAAGKVYPFPKLASMDYYGLWPEKTLDAGLAYYEVYQTEEGLLTSYYFDREDTSQLMNNADTVVISDGYCVFTTNKSDKITVSVDGNTIATNLTPGNNAIPITMSSITSPDANSYYVVKLPQSVLNAATGDTYYHKLDIQITGSGRTENVVAYFNSNVAISQVNSVNRPTVVPGIISIRSARQLAELMGEPAIWASNCKYIQYLNIDANAYTANGYSDADRAAILGMIDAGGSIGSEAMPFQGSYSGNGYAQKAQIVNFKPGHTSAGASGSGTAGLFGVIGNSGTVDCLEVRFDEPVTMNYEVGSAGLLAGISSGTIQQVDLILENTASVTAGNSTGLLAGTLGGNVHDCTLSIGNAVTLAADNAGAFAGTGANGVVQNITLIQNDHTDSANGTAVGLTVNADNAGAFAGSLTEMKTENIAIEMDTVQANADALGGYAGSVNGGSASSVSVQIDTVLQNTRTPEEGKATYAAGMAGTSLGVQYNLAEVTMNGQISGSSAAGMFGSVAEGKVQGATVHINGPVSGSVDAAGFAVKVGEGNGVIENALVYLKSANSAIAAGSRAAGFAVELGGTTLGTGVRMGQYQRTQNALSAVSSVTIRGDSQAAGYACTVTGSVNNGTVMGAAQITSANGTAAGFAADIAGSGRVAVSGVTPALGDQTSDYRFNSNSNLRICGSAAAGFAGIIGKSASVENSYTLGSIASSAQADASASVAGFALTNDGEINGCTANISISGGSAFAATNNGTISNCYGWYGDGAALNNTTVVYEPDDSGEYRSSYFVDIDILEGEDEGTDESVVLFDADGLLDTMYPSELSNALNRLNGENGYDWFAPATYGAKPYSTITPATYSYPMLRTHYGDWVTTPQYAYGVMYYEKHEITDESGNVEDVWKYNILDLTDIDLTIEEQSLSCSNSNFTDVDSVISDAGYAVFCRTSDDPNSLFAADCGWRLGDAIPLVDENGEATSFRSQVYDAFLNKVSSRKDGRYSFYEIDTDGALTFDGKEGDVSVVTWFANAINVAGTEQDPYSIRTAEQFSNVGNLSASCFKQMHTIHADNFQTISDFAGIYDGNNLDLTISEANSWINTLSGTVSNVRLTVTGNVNQYVIGTVSAAGTVMFHDTITVHGEVASSASLFGTVLGSVTTGEIETGMVSGSLISTISGTVQTGAISTGDVNGSLFGQVSGAETAASLTTGDIVTGAVPAESNGWLIRGIRSSNVTLGAVTVDIPYVDVGTMIGSVTNGSVVNGSTVTLSNSAVADHLVGEISCSTVRDFAVTAESLKTSLIASVAGAAATQNSAAQSADLSGIQLTAGNSTGFTGSGLLVNVLGDSSRITDCSVAVGAITVSAVENIPGHNEGDTPTKSFGGITGVVPADAVLTDNTVSMALNLTGENNMLTIVGGLAAINRGQIIGTESGSSYADMNVTYTQTAGDAANGVADDMVGIGGLVGWMRPGSSMEQIGASGSISLAEGSTGSGRDNYFIGGAIAYDDNASYENVTTDVAVSDAWAGTQLFAGAGTADRTNPSGKGTVGKFVGYVSGGSFTDCSATSPIGAYQFLGQIVVNETQITNDNLYTTPDVSEQTELNWDHEPTAEDLLTLGFSKVNGDVYTYYTYPAVLNNCTFVWVDADGNSNTYKQGFDPTYVYGNTLTPRDLYTAVNVGKATYTAQTGLYYDDFDPGLLDNKSQYLTSYYYKDEQGRYFQVYGEYSRSGILGFYRHHYKLKYSPASGGWIEIHSKSNLTNPGTTPYDGVTLYTKTSVNDFPSDYNGKNFMIVSTDGKHALGLDGNRVDFVETFDLAVNTEIQKAIWTVTGTGNKTNWVNMSNPDQKLALTSELQWGGYREYYNNTSGYTITIGTSQEANDARAFSIKGEQYLRYTDSAFHMEYTSGGLHIYRVDASGKTWGTKFDLRSEIDYTCVPTDLSGNPVMLSEAAVAEDPVVETILSTVTDFSESLPDALTALIPEFTGKNEN